MSLGHTLEPPVPSLFTFHVAATWVRDTRNRFPDAGWQIRTAGQATPQLRRFIDRIELFLGLVAITALLVGGIGIGSAVANYIADRTATIATLKSLGATTGVIYAAYAAQIAMLATAGIAAGLVLGAVLPSAAAPFLAKLLGRYSQVVWVDADAAFVADDPFPDWDGDIGMV